ncbi:hypothetical protein [Ignavibacterium sp.]|uniref:hypothetical protein n=1 Tax=Ignavibacterium sp. TaxID=2651167 RepID=UPI00307ED17C
MKTHNIQFVVIILVGIMGMISCSKKSDNPVAPGGSQTTELKLTIGTQQITFNQGIGGYAVNENVSYIQFTKVEAGDTLMFTMIFTGKATGNQNWDVNNDLGAILIQYGASGTLIYSPLNGSTNITAYGNVGSYISGTFTGQLQDSNGSSVNVSGNFSVQRLADIQSIGKGNNSPSISNRLKQ